MFGLSLLDIAVIVVYLAALLAIGFSSARTVRNTGDFFVGGRRFGKFMSTMLGFASGTHADQAVGVVSKSYQVGLAGIWYEWIWLFLTPFYWVIAPLIRRIRVVTTADFFLKRYDRRIASLYAVIGIVTLMLLIGTMLLASGRIIEAASGGQIPFAVSVGLMTTLFVSYGIAGGLVATVNTDVLQGALIIVLSFIIPPFALARLGGFHGLHERLAGAPNDLFSLVTPGEITLFFIVVVGVNALVGWPIQPQRFSDAGASKTEMDIRIGAAYGSFIKRFCTAAWAFTGVCCLALFPDLKNPDHAFGEAARTLLPAGVIGLFLASVLASVQSACASFMIAASGMFTRTIYRPYIVPGKNDAHYLAAARAISLAVVAGGLLFAFFLPGVPRAVELFWKVAALMGIPFWLGIVWRRANSWSVWAGFTASFAVLLAGEAGFFTGGRVPLPWQMIAYLSAGLAAGIIAGLATKPQEKETLDRFFEDLRRPVEKAEHLATDTL